MTIEVGVDEISAAEGRKILDDAARRLLHIDGDEFLKRWDAGELQDFDHVAAMRVAMLIPLARWAHVAETS